MKPCVRCGSDSDVRVVKYIRDEQKFSEPWCRSCRHQKLVGLKGKSREHQRRPIVLRAALLVMAIAILAAVVALIVRQAG